MSFIGEVMSTTYEYLYYFFLLSDELFMLEIILLCPIKIYFSIHQINDHIKKIVPYALPLFNTSYTSISEYLVLSTDFLFIFSLLLFPFSSHCCLYLITLTFPPPTTFPPNRFTYLHICES